ncbi:TRAP transporter small permease subunit [Paracandidimonas soli]|uniref:TRAP transporter small permease subunit n=1 Tax=Paracandidimonas soli TaxID=1917182 RepID=UPI0033411E8F
MRFINYLNQKIGDYASLLYLAVFVVMVYDVGARYYFSKATSWGLELIIALVGIHYVLAGAHAIKNNTHVRIDVIYNLLPRKVRRWMDVLALLLSMVFLLIIVYYGYEQAITAVEIGERSGAGWNSLAPTYMKVAIPAGAFLMVLQCLSNLVDTIKEMRNEQ